MRLFTSPGHRRSAAPGVPPAAVDLSACSAVCDDTGGASGEPGVARDVRLDAAARRIGGDSAARTWPADHLRGPGAALAPVRLGAMARRPRPGARPRGGLRKQSPLGRASPAPSLQPPCSSRRVSGGSCRLRCPGGGRCPRLGGCRAARSSVRRSWLQRSSRSSCWATATSASAELPKR